MKIMFKIRIQTIYLIKVFQKKEEMIVHYFILNLNYNKMGFR